MQKHSEYQQKTANMQLRKEIYQDYSKKLFLPNSIQKNRYYSRNSSKEGNIVWHQFQHCFSFDIKSFLMDIYFDFLVHVTALNLLEAW